VEGQGGIAAKGSSGPLFPSSTPRPKPKSLLEAISDIEQLAAAEKTGMKIPLNFLLFKEKVSFFDVGLKGGWADTLVSAIFIPISVGVVDKVIPIFGTHDPSLIDQAFALVMAMSYTLGYNVLMAFNLGTCFFGKVCRNSIWQLYGGFVTGSFIKMLLIFLVFHYMYWTITPQVISSAMSASYWLVRPVLTLETWDAVFYWAVEMRNVLFRSSIFVVVSTLLCLLIPLLSFLLGSYQATSEDAKRRRYDGY
jgi:hypothetical protein